MKSVVAILFIFISGQACFAQYNRVHYYRHKGKASVQDESKSNVGFGYGYDYGGLGARYTFLPTPTVGAFVCGGFAVAGFGWNVGVQGRLNPNNKIVPTLGAMYGVNGAIYVEGVNGYSKLYYGPSVSLGVMWRSTVNEGNFWNFEVVVPIRPSNYNSDIDAVKKNPQVKLYTDMYKLSLPISISVGYHFGS
ncbi:MAG: hypothetical protein JST48_14135 [Bacteroidetes bacterium]|nr:hypothetical protein [Bacteroidota bacterium]